MQNPVREKLLYLLERAASEGRALSGEVCAERIGVSRVAVWKTVQKLCEEGWEIETVKGRGYSLSPSCRRLSAGRIRAHLPPDMTDAEIQTFAQTESTNRCAKLYADGKNECRAIFASDSQTGGRGRLGRSFYSPPGSGVYFSYLFSSPFPLEKLNAVTPFAAAATAKILENYTKETIGIKWVNDLYFKEKKVCGILTEALTSLESGSENKIVVGIGINLETSDFPDELKEKAGSLGIGIERCALIAQICAELHRFEKDPCDRSFMSDYRARSTVTGKNVILDRWGEKISGRVVGFDDDGGLLLDVGKEQPLLFTGGEISLRLS